MGGLWQDVQLATRLLAKDRRFTIAAVIALGLGIGVNTTVFSLINLAVFRDVPFDEPDRLVAVRAFDARGNELGLSYPDFRDVRDQTSSFSALSANIDGLASISEENRAPERFRGTYVSAATFRLLRSAPILGRDFVPADDEPGAPPVAIIGYAVWQGRYGGDPSVVGRTVRVNSVPTVVVGVMPAGFKYPFITEVWMPLSQWPGAANARRDARNLGVTARLRDGVSLEQTRADLEVVASRLARAYAATNSNIALAAKRLKDQRPNVPRPIMTAMAGAVAFVLLIAYANLANLLLARSVTRAREIAVRISLGATRWRVIRQLLVECGMVAFLGSVLGFVIGLYGVNQLVTAFEVIEAGATPGTTRPYWIIVTPNEMVYGFVALLCVTSALGFGLLPAWHISKTSAAETLKETGRGGTGGRRARRWTSALLVGELALTLIVLTGAGLLWRSFITQFRTDAVVDAAHVVAMRLTLPQQSYRTPGNRRQFLQQLDERLTRLSMFSSASMASHAPLEFGGPARALSIDGVSMAPDQPIVSYVLTGRRYFETLKLPIAQGRDFAVSDSLPGRRGAIVDQRFASRFFPGQSALGRRIRLAAVQPPGSRTPDPNLRDTGDWLTIVGIARTIPQPGPAELVRPIVYVPLAAEPNPDARAVILVNGDLGSAARALREEMRALDPNLPLFAIETLDRALARSRWPTVFIGTWFGVLAVVALVLASVGLYALTAHLVAQRVHEIGVRMALGAQSRQVLWLFVRRTVVQLAFGLALGVVGALGVGTLLAAFLRETNPRDPITLAIVIVLLCAVSMIASLVPARRAARVDPMVVLRAE